MSTWRVLQADAAMVRALDTADVPTSRTAIRAELVRLQTLQAQGSKPSFSGLRELRKRWSEQFARACATMVANQLRTRAELQKFQITPDSTGGNQEFFTPLGYNKGKRIDVVVSADLVGLQIGISLKGLNFRDGDGGNFDKNLTGRLYELRDEISTVHDYLPRAFMAGLFFLPVASCFDKVTGASSFAHAVAQLRSRSGRLDPSLASQNWKCDFAAVGLYGSGEPEEVRNGVPRGVARYFPLVDEQGGANSPPKRNLPVLSSTVDLGELVRRLVVHALRGTASGTSFTDLTDESVSISLGDGSVAGEVGDDEPQDDALDTT